MVQLIYALASIFLLKFFWEYSNDEIRQYWNRFEFDDYKLLSCRKTDYGYRATVQCINEGNFEHLKTYRESFNKIYSMKTYLNNKDYSDEILIDFVKKRDKLKYKYIELNPYELLIGYNYKYQPIKVNMKITPHLGVVGISNNGKSKCIELALRNLRGADITLLNCFDDDFTDIKANRINGIDDILDYFYYLCNEDDIKERPLYVVLDEYNVISNIEGIDESIENLLRQARHRNIFIIVIMQQATKDECNFKNLFNCRLCFKQIDKSQYYSFIGSVVEETNLKQMEFILLHEKLEYGTSYLL